MVVISASEFTVNWLPTASGVPVQSVSAKISAASEPPVPVLPSEVPKLTISYFMPATSGLSVLIPYFFAATASDGKCFS